MKADCTMEFSENKDEPDISDAEEETNLSDDNGKLRGYNQGVYFLTHQHFFVVCQLLNC